MLLKVRRPWDPIVLEFNFYFLDIPSLQELVGYRNALREALFRWSNLPVILDAQTFVIMVEIQEGMALGPPTLLFTRGSLPSSLDDAFLLLVAHPQFHLVSDRILHLYREYSHSTTIIRAGNFRPYSPVTAMANGYFELDRLSSAVDRVLLQRLQSWVAPLLPVQSPLVRETAWHTFGIQMEVPLFILYIFKEVSITHNMLRGYVYITFSLAQSLLLSQDQIPPLQSRPLLSQTLVIPPPQLVWSPIIRWPKLSWMKSLQRLPIFFEKFTPFQGAFTITIPVIWNVNVPGLYALSLGSTFHPTLDISAPRRYFFRGKQ